ncbi:MAG: RelA/SpoT family protein [Lachnospirales bacterium]
MTQDKKLFNELIEKIKLYHPNPNLENVERAYLLAKEAHGNQLRKSGEPYIIHPICVAIILAELELDIESIIAGLLHDVIEDTVHGYKDIETMFSKEVAILVDGVTKLTNMEYSNKENEQAENYRKMFLATATDIRVILIKISDRLHNMRTLNFMKPSKQIEKAQETQDIYAPICERLGVSKIRYEMEDLCFKYLHPEEYVKLVNLISVKQQERTKQVNKIVEELKVYLAEEKIEASIAGRPKHLFSIYKKMKNQNKSIEQIFDLIAVRVLVERSTECYTVLGVTHAHYTPISKRFKDYISNPKPNGYQSLHNTLISSDKTIFEVQIRTYDMHRVSEYGIAAHWKYKSGKNVVSEKAKEEAKLNWLKQLLELQNDVENNDDFLSAIKGDLDLYSDRVYCYTPKGKIVDLVEGATPIDFAYAIHSAVGNQLIGAKVNMVMVPIYSKLKTGDVVEILTSQNVAGPSRDWLNHVATSQAKSKIGNWFKKTNKQENFERGKEMLEKEAKKKGYKLQQLLTKDAMNIVLNKYCFRDWESLCASIGSSAIKDGQVINRLIEEKLKADKVDLPEDAGLNNILNEIKDKQEREEKKSSKQNQKDRLKRSTNGVDLKGVGYTPATFSKCCTPVPGDEICAYIRRGNGIAIHRTDCTNMLILDDVEKQRVIEAFWPQGVGENRAYDVNLALVCEIRQGLLNNIAFATSEDKIDISNLNTRYVKDTCIINIEIRIKSIDQLEKIKKRFAQIEGVIEVKRVAN